MKKSVLLVDDSATVRQLLRDMLSRDYEVFEAKHGQEGLDILKKLKVNIVITDINMPIMDGYKFIREAKKLTKFVPYIVITSDDGPDAMRLIKEAGAATFIKKPFEAAQVRKILSIIA